MPRALGTGLFTKIQINFVELFKYKLKNKIAFNLLKEIDKKEFLFLFEDMSELLEYNLIKVYDIKEILLEKNRAILTRRSLKARDFIDIFLILKYINKNFKLFEPEIIKKTMFMLDKYVKYNDNLEIRFKLGIKYLKGDEERLLLKPLDKDFIKFTDKISIFLNNILIFLINYKKKRKI
jgi:hypothetical protein